MSEEFRAGYGLGVMTGFAFWVIWSLWQLFLRAPHEQGASHERD